MRDGVSQIYCSFPSTDQFQKYGLLGDVTQFLFRDVSDCGDRLWQSLSINH